MSALPRFRCRCGRGFASSLCSRMGRVDVWCCDACARAWWAEYEAEVAQRFALAEAA